MSCLHPDAPLLSFSPSVFFPVVESWVPEVKVAQVFLVLPCIGVPVCELEFMISRALLSHCGSWNGCVVS